MIPVVFIHNSMGNPGVDDCFRVCVKQATIRNHIILMTNMKFESVETVEIPKEEKFTSIYRHASTNPIHYELFCFTRWFHLLSLMDTHGFKKIFYADSDLMVYSNISEVLKDSPTSYIFGCKTYPFKWFSSSAHSSLWEYGTLKDFCDYLLEMYSSNWPMLEEMYRGYKNHRSNGGLCDMTLLGMFQHERAIPDLGSICEGGTFDERLQTTKGYKGLDQKEIYWDRNLPYCETIDGKRVRFHSLHLQGEAKGLASQLFRSKFE